MGTASADNQNYIREELKEISRLLRLIIRHIEIKTGTTVK